MEVHTSPWWRKILPCLAALALALLGVTAASPASAAGAPKVSVSVTAASVADGLGLKVSGSGFSDLPKASTGAPAAGVYVALRDPATMSNAQINADQNIVPAVAYVPSAAINGGAWSASLKAPVSKLSADANYEVIVWTAHGEITDSTFLGSDKVTLTAAQKAALFPDAAPKPAPKVSVSVTAASVADGLGLKVSGSGFSDLPKASTGAPAAGVYVALRDPATMSNAQINADQNIVPAVAYVPSAAINGGAWSASLKAPVSKLSADANYEVIVWTAHGEITDSTFLGSDKVILTAAQKAALFPEATGTPTPSPSSSSATSTPAPTPSSSSTTAPQPTSTPTPSATSTATSTSPAQPTSAPTAKGSPEPSVTCTVQTVPGSAGTPQLAWGVKSSFVSYIEGGIANGTVATSGGASRSGNGFLWGAGSGSLDSSSGQGTVSFPGSVHFTGHDGALDITISGLQVKMSSARSGVLLANVSSLGLDGNRVGGQGLAFANLQFSGSAAGGGTASVALTAAGAKAFAGFYTAGEAMDSLTLSFTGAHSASTQQVCQNADGETVSTGGDGGGASVNTGGQAPTGTSGSGHAADFGLAGGGAAVLALLMVALRRRQLAGR